MLIRSCVDDDMPRLLEIWMQATLHAHDFLPAAMWWPRQEAMRRRLQDGAEIWVVEPLAHEVERSPVADSSPLNEFSVVGFMAIKDEELLALYVHPEFQCQGIGSMLMALAQQHHLYLYLHVCIRNSDAVRFYQKHGFRAVRERKESQTGCDEYLMEYRTP
ncbi:MAG: GNAT family N-acetyltransferase [Aeromonadaceae bacterium]